MSDRHDPTTNVTDRLSRLADQPVPDAVRGTHLNRMAAAESLASAPTRFGRLAVAGAAIVGFVVGSTGFAMAGALPGPAQGMAHDVLSVVQVDVPDRPGKGNGPPDAILEDPCTGPPSWAIDKDMTAEDKAAAQAERRDTCGADDAERREGNGPPEGVGPGGPPQSVLDDPCTGPSPWAVDKDMTAEDKAAAQAERRDSCEADDTDAAEGEGDGEADGTLGPAGDAGPSDRTGPPDAGSSDRSAPSGDRPPADTAPPESTEAPGSTEVPDGMDPAKDADRPEGTDQPEGTDAPAGDGQAEDTGPATGAGPPAG